MREKIRRTINKKRKSESSLWNGLTLLINSIDFVKRTLTVSDPLFSTIRRATYSFLTNERSEAHPVDIVVKWVTYDDEKWRNAMLSRKAEVTNCQSNGIRRFRDWNTLRFFFRSVEKNVPWVRHIHLVTFGHYPGWLNREHPKLRLWKHEDIFQERSHLPTFNSNSIDMNLASIPGLSPHFIHCEDDQFFLKSLPKNFFFRFGMPVMDLYDRKLTRRSIWDDVLHNNIELVNRHFHTNFSGLSTTHFPMPLLKCHIIEVWNSFGEAAEQTSASRFRAATDIDIFLFEEWAFAKREFSPVLKPRKNLLKKVGVAQEFFSRIDGGVCLGCLNDDVDEIDPEQENVLQELISRGLQEIFPKPSLFEK